LGVWPPKCSRILWKPPKGTSLAENTHVGMWIVPVGQEMRPGRALKKAKKEIYIIIIIVNKVLIKVTLNKVIAGALYIVICG